MPEPSILLTNKIYSLFIIILTTHHSSTTGTSINFKCAHVRCQKHTYILSQKQKYTHTYYLNI